MIEINGADAAKPAMGMIVGLAFPVSRQEVMVHVYNYAGVPAKTLAKALRHSEGIYQRAGLDTRWAEDPMTKRGPTSFVMRIAPEAMVAKWTPRCPSLTSGGKNWA